jgi:hypothetical protein
MPLFSPRLFTVPVPANVPPLARVPTTGNDCNSVGVGCACAAVIVGVENNISNMAIAGMIVSLPIFILVVCMDIFNSEYASGLHIYSHTVDMWDIVRECARTTRN